MGFAGGNFLEVSGVEPCPAGLCEALFIIVLWCVISSVLYTVVEGRGRG